MSACLRGRQDELALPALQRGQWRGGGRLVLGCWRGPVALAPHQPPAAEAAADRVPAQRPHRVSAQGRGSFLHAGAAQGTQAAGRLESEGGGLAGLLPSHERVKLRRRKMRVLAGPPSASLPPSRVLRGGLGSETLLPLPTRRPFMSVWVAGERRDWPPGGGRRKEEASRSTLKTSKICAE